jgi:SulP family sulfate permease
VAIEVGIVVAAFVFMFRMAEVVEVSSGIKLIDSENDETVEGLAQRELLPKDVEAFQISGPLFFGATSRLDDVLDQFRQPPKVFILRMRLVPFIDASGVHALRMLLDRCRRRDIVLVMSGLQAQPLRVVHQMHLAPRDGELHFVTDFDAALQLALSLIGEDSANDGAVHE